LYNKFDYFCLPNELKTDYGKVSIIAETSNLLSEDKTGITKELRWLIKTQGDQFTISQLNKLIDDDYENISLIGSYYFSRFDERKNFQININNGECFIYNKKIDDYCDIVDIYSFVFQYYYGEEGIDYDELDKLVDQVT
jgi:hypothetical protein